MTKKVYTFGYSGKDTADLDRLVDDLGAVVFDVRFSPRSRNPHWNRRALEALLGDRYRHVRALGNANYRGGPIEIVDLEEGVRTIQASPQPVILMCVCKDPRICHRTTIADHLRALGFDVEELDERPPLQMRLL